MADSTIQLPAEGSGPKLDTENLTVGANSVHRERVQVTGTAAADIAPVDATAGLKVDLGADNDVTVTGTVTVDLGANNDVTVQGEAAENAAVSGNPVLTGGRYDATPRTLGDGDVGAVALDADGAVHISDGGNTLTVDGTVTADAGTGPWPVTDNGGSLTVDNAGTFAVQVDAALPAGTNAIGKLAANSGVDIGDVDVLSLPGVDTEGAALGSGMLIQGDDGTDRTNVLVDTDGHLQVDVLSGGGGVSATDDAAFTVATDSVTPTGYLADETTPDSVDEGDVGIPRMTLSRKPYAVITDATSENNAAVDGSGHLQVDIAADSVGIGGGTQYTEDAAAAADPVGNQLMSRRRDTLTTAEVSTDGDVIAVNSTSKGELHVKHADNLTVDAGTGWTSAATEDDPAAANPDGPYQMLVRLDTPGTLTSADGDVVARRGTNYGAAYTQIVDSSGNFVDSFGGSGGTSATDDAAFVVGTGTGTPAMFLADETTPDSVDEGDVGVGRMTLSRKQLVTLSDPTSENHAAVDASGHVQVDIAADSAGLATAANQLPDGHNVTVDNAAGASAVNIQDGGNSITVDNADITTIAGAVAGSEMQVDIVSDGAGLATAANQPAVYTDDTSTHATGTSEGNLLMAAATPTDSAVDANDIGAVAMSVDRRLHVDAQIVGQDADVTIADGGNVISVDDGGANLSVDWGGTVPPIGAGTEAAALRVTLATDSTGVVSVDDNGGALTVDQATASSLNAQVVGAVAHDGADSGNPIKVGAKAVAMGSNPTAVAANDRTDLYATRAGQLFTIGGHPNIITREYLATTAQTDDPIIDTIAAGTRVVITMIDVTVDNACSVDVGVRIGFGTASVPTIPTDGNSVTGVVVSHPGIAAGSGIVKGSGAGIVAMGASNEELRITNEVPTGGAVRVVVTYYTTAA